MNKDVLTYLATPYWHDKPSVRQERFERITRDAAILFKCGYLIVSPITHGHVIASQFDKTKQHYEEQWRKISMALLSACQNMIFPLRSGWQESSGLRSELRYALAEGKHVYQYSTVFDSLDRFTIEDLVYLEEEYRNEK